MREEVVQIFQEKEEEFASSDGYRGKKGMRRGCG